MGLCGICEGEVVVSDLPVLCSGKCARVFHCKCTTLTRSMAKLITDNVNVLFKCDECLSSQSCDEQNVTTSHVKRMEEEVKKLSSLSESVIGMRDHIAAQIDTALKTGMEDLKHNVNGLLEKLISENLKNMTSSFLEINAEKKLAATNVLPSGSRPIHSESDKNNPKKDKRKFENNDNRSNDDVFDAPWVEVVKRSNAGGSKGNKMSSKPNNRKTRPVIVIKPKESKQACDDTRKFLKQQLDPKTHKVSNFRNGKDGSIIVECATGANVNDVKNGIESNLGENYSAVVPTSVPKLKIVGMSEQYSSEKIIDYLRSQNEDIAIKDVKVVDLFENPRFIYNKFNAVIEVDVDTYKCLLCAKYVNVGFDWCAIYPAIKVVRCFQCGEFGHMSNECKNGVRCSRCSQQHKTSECTSTVLKCINCLKMRNERKVNLDVNHAAYSYDCFVHKRLFDQKQSSLRFNK